MASDNATVAGKFNEKSKSRRKKKIRRGRNGKAKAKANVQYLICKCQWFPI